jgi:hypothetical protein
MDLFADTDALHHAALEAFACVPGHLRLVYLSHDGITYMAVRDPKKGTLSILTQDRRLVLKKRLTTGHVSRPW